MTAYESLLADLAEEAESLDALVAPLADEQWNLPTPAAGWTIADQISHLAGFDGSARLSMADPEAFSADLASRLAEDRDPIAEYTATGRTMAPGELLEWWRGARRSMIETASVLDPKTRVPWYGPPMSAMSSVTARMMETWAHGQDVRDTLGVIPSATHRLRHVAHIGVGARAFAYVLNDLGPADVPVDVVLTAPDGTTWTWGPGDAADRVSGPALDFCLLVTQRRHLDDVSLELTGEEAVRWMRIAQAFAGAAGGGRSAGQFE